MKTFNVIDGRIIVSPLDRVLSVKGDNGAQQIAFKLNRHQHNIDLNELDCIIKIRGANGVCDVVVPDVTINSDNLYEVTWTIGGAATVARGDIQLQLEFHDRVATVDQLVWQSHIAVFTIMDGLASDAIFTPSDPSILTQWQKRIADIQTDVNTKFTAVSGAVDTINSAIPRIDSGLSVIETTVPQFEAGMQDLDALATRFEGNLGTIDTLTASMTAVQGQVATLQTDVAALQATPAPSTSLGGFSGTATYQDGFFNVDIANKPDTMPDVYTVTFIAPANFTAGDKLRINGVPHIVNVFGKGYGKPISEWSSFKASYLYDGYATFAQRTPSTTVDAIATKTVGAGLTPSTDYTLVYDIKETSINGMFWVAATSTSTGPWPYGKDVSIDGTATAGIYKRKMTTAAAIGSTSLIWTYLRGNATGAITLRTMLLEGDRTAETLPAAYWEGTYGEYPIVTRAGDAAAGCFLKGTPVVLTVCISGAYLG